MTSDSIPAVLIPPKPLSAISMERALNQILKLLQNIEPEDDRQEDMVLASIDDVRVMLMCINR